MREQATHITGHYHIMSITISKKALPHTNSNTCKHLWMACLQIVGFLLMHCDMKPVLIPMSAMGKINTVSERISSRPHFSIFWVNEDGWTKGFTLLCYRKIRLNFM
jgi:hypothetical protein